MALLLGVVMAGCNKDEVGGGISLEPTVDFTTPLHADTDLDVHRKITATFKVNRLLFKIQRVVPLFT